MLLFLDGLDFSVVLVSSQIFLFGSEEISIPLKPFNLDWIDCSDHIPVNVLSARWLRHSALVDPSILVVDGI